MFSVIDVHESGDGPLYVEDVFSAFTYTGNGSTQSIVNGIDLAGKGGSTWLKGRSGATDHALYDTARGVTKELVSNATNAEIIRTVGLTAFNADGFSLGNRAELNTSTATYIGWTFRKAKKFFDVKTYTGNGVAGRQIAHDLGVAPGMIIVKPYSASGSWSVYHRSAPSNPTNLFLDTTAAGGPNQFSFGDGTSLVHPSDTVFTIGQNNNNSGDQYVAYIFAHDDSADGVIQCGTFTGNTDVPLGWEAQFVLIKRTDGTSDWRMLDTSRAWNTSAADASLLANTSAAETTSADYGTPTSSGFTTANHTGTYVYLAIRKGLMRPPTDASKVFDILAAAGTSSARSLVSSTMKQGVDLAIIKPRDVARKHCWADRLRGTASQLTSDSTAAETTLTTSVTSFNMNGISLGTDNVVNNSGNNHIYYLFKEAAGFFQRVGYTGTGAARTVPHNLGVVPELMIVKDRNRALAWPVYYFVDATKGVNLNETSALITSGRWNNTHPTSSVFSIGAVDVVNTPSDNYIAYLFASCPGVSKIGTYTGTGAAQNIDCGFAAGARFVMIKRIDSTGNWRYADSTRGIISGNDPYLLFNSTAAEVTSADYLAPLSSGFTVNGSDSDVNASGGTYLYLSVA